MDKGKSAKRKLTETPNESLKKRKTTLSDQLAELTDPTPKDFDPEEPQWDSGLPNYDEYEEQDFQQSSSLGFKEAPTKKRILPDIVMGAEYRGKKTSRKALGGTGSHSESFSDEVDNRVSAQPVFSMNLDESSSDAETSSEVGSKSENNDIMQRDQALDRQNEADNLEKLFEDAQAADEEGAPDFSNVESQRKKAQHTMNQRIMWDAIVDIRINFQNLIEIGNRMPQPTKHALFDKTLKQDNESCSFDVVGDTLKGLLEELGQLQQKLLETDPVVKVSVSPQSEDYANWDYISQTQKKIELCCEPILDKWHAKAMMPSVAQNRNQTLKLKAINQSIMAQVESSLSGHNLDNLISRSQIVPVDANKVFGSQHNNQNKDNDTEEANNTKHRYDPEIYNDEDFYAELLRDRIQSGVQGLGDTSDPIAMSQQYLRLRQLRKRKHKKPNLDRRASKGRKIRYHVHEKLTTFMAPIRHQYPKQDSLLTQRLFRSLFGSAQDGSTQKQRNKKS